MNSVLDPLHSQSDPGRHWTTGNIGEAMPGVATPLSASVWGESVDLGLIAAAFALGAITSKERGSLGPPGARIVQLFHGRAAVDADFLALMGDRMPGATGEQVVQSLFGRVPETMTFHPTVRRYPIVAVKLPLAFCLQPRRVKALSSDYDLWWRRSIDSLGSADPARAAVFLREATDRLYAAARLQSVAVITGVQPVYEALATLVEAAGADSFSLLSAPPGGAESAVVADLWKASRGDLTADEVAARHGFHGPNEGELSARVWREDREVLDNLINQYRGRDDAAAPTAKEAARARERAACEQQLLSALRPLQRPGARAILRLLQTRIPLRGVVKRSELQSLDVARAAARVIGRELAARGQIESADDIFYLTLDEILSTAPESREIVADRRRQRAAHARVQVPELWRGDPDAQVVPSARPERSTNPGVVEGVGVSAGVVEGVVRVVTDPSFTDVEPDEVLVAPTTDPSWSSIMFISTALVVDIGGPLSHAAVVARELGIPCVVNTRSGTRDLQTGDIVRVDGTTGRIEILAAADPVTTHRAPSGDVSSGTPATR